MLFFEKIRVFIIGIFCFLYETPYFQQLFRITEGNLAHRGQKTTSSK